MRITAPDLPRLGVIDAIVPSRSAAPTATGTRRRRPCGPRIRDQLTDLVPKSRRRSSQNATRSSGGFGAFERRDAA